MIIRADKLLPFNHWLGRVTEFINELKVGLGLDVLHYVLEVVPFSSQQLSQHDALEAEVNSSALSCFALSRGVAIAFSD